jgi:tetratricopeptide (TPR) repeat protein
MENVVEIGGYVLEPGSPAGTLLRQGEAAEGSAESLQRAFDAASEQGAGKAEPALATEVDAASEATSKIERAVALCKGIGEGQALSPAQLGLEVGALLDCLERLDRKKEHRKSLQMARALATLLMLLKRWADLLRTLHIALRAGEQLDDLDAVAWAKHELGTLRLAAGDVESADRDLRRAREIRERIGDRRGLAATERNMQVLCERLRAMLHNEELVRHKPPNRRIARLLPFAALLVVLFGGGVAAGMMISDNSGPGDTSETVAKTTGNGNTPEGHETPPGGDGKTDNPSHFDLVITIAGNGGGSVFAAGYECAEPVCEFSLPSGTEVQFDYKADAESSFEGFSGACSGFACSFTMTEPMSVTATFEPEEPEASDSGDSGSTSAEESKLRELKEGEGTEEEVIPTTPEGE